MPIYEYQCESCTHQLEKLQKMNDDRLVDCPECGQPALKRMVSAAAFRLKGSGWYETDFKKDNKRNLADSGDAGSSDKKSASKDGKAKETSSTDSKTNKADSTPASKSAAKSAAKPASKESNHA